jgi:hypothetical protein
MDEDNTVYVCVYISDMRCFERSWRARVWNFLRGKSWHWSARDESQKVAWANGYARTLQKANRESDEACRSLMRRMNQEYMVTRKTRGRCDDTAAA